MILWGTEYRDQNQNITIYFKMGEEWDVQRVKCSLCKHKDLSLAPSTTYNLGMGPCTSDASVVDTEGTDGSWGLAGYPV